MLFSSQIEETDEDKRQGCKEVKYLILGYPHIKIGNLHDVIIVITDIIIVINHQSFPIFTNAIP